MSDELKPIIEALIFASPDPLTPKTLFLLLDGEPPEDVERALEALRADYEERGGLQMVQVAGGYQICTRPELHEWVRRLFHEHSKQRLSVQALETLAVIAYKQPITGPEIAEIRGVNTSAVVGTLLERQLVKVVGRKQVVGRPFVYATTREFLNRFGLSDLSDLPKVEEMAEALGLDVPPDSPRRGRRPSRCRSRVSPRRPRTRREHHPSRCIEQAAEEARQPGCRRRASGYRRCWFPFPVVAAGPRQSPCGGA